MDMNGLGLDALFSRSPQVQRVEAAPSLDSSCVRNRVVQTSLFTMYHFTDIAMETLSGASMPRTLTEYDFYCPTPGTSEINGRTSQK